MPELFLEAIASLSKPAQPEAFDAAVDDAFSSRSFDGSSWYAALPQGTRLMPGASGASYNAGVVRKANEDSCYELFYARCPLAPGVRILDCGSGDGLFLEQTLRRQPEAFCVGICNSAALVAKSRARELKRACFKEASFDDFLPTLPTASFDVVVFHESVGYSHDRSALFREVARVLAPGGLLWVSTACFVDIRTEFIRRLIDIWGYNFSTYGSLHADLTSARFNTIGAARVLLARSFRERPWREVFSGVASFLFVGGLRSYFWRWLRGGFAHPPLSWLRRFEIVFFEARTPVEG
jgi:SAM-dependent methyltransferase